MLVPMICWMSTLRLIFNRKKNRIYKIAENEEPYMSAYVSNFVVIDGYFLEQQIHTCITLLLQWICYITDISLSNQE